MVAAGELYWVRLRSWGGSAPNKRRPALVVQADLVNRSNIQTVIMAAVTSNMLLAEVRGNVRLRKREGQLDKASVVNVSQLVTCDNDELLDRIGALTAERMAQVRAGLALVLGIPTSAG